MSSAEASGARIVESDVPARVDRMPWSRWRLRRAGSGMLGAALRVATTRARGSVATEWWRFHPRTESAFASGLWSFPATPTRGAQMETR
jgi:hypothetical protein